MKAAKASSYIQRKLHEAISRLFRRNFAGLKQWLDLVKVLDRKSTGENAPSSTALA